VTSGYAGKRVLVTGGLGFLGLNLVAGLLRAGARVAITNRSSTPRSLAWLAGITRGTPVELVLADSPPSSDQLDGLAVVFNLAGRSGAVQSLVEARADMQANIEFHLKLLETVRRCTPPPRVVFTSSRLVYGDTGSVPVLETHPPQPTSLYGLHKLTVEHYHRLYHIHYGVPYSVVRLTNPYGPFQAPERRGYGIINEFIMSAIRDEAITIYGDGSQLRDYPFAEDVVDAILAAGLSERAVGQTMNVGLGRSVRLADFAELIVEIAGAGRIVKTPWPELDRKVETGDSLCSIELARHLLGWAPRFDWRSGIARSVEAYRTLLS
jgi:nucleoside-diphosphate-sugar epimerase